VFPAADAIGAQAPEVHQARGGDVCVQAKQEAAAFCTMALAHLAYQLHGPTIGAVVIAEHQQFALAG
jgi:hypothetical protein